ncbi:MAG: hypothetical protein RIR18_332 [Pseudomonadota bacterium]|jgi:predicted transcriptional regulator
MIKPAQIRAARSLLSWSQQELADRAVLSLTAINRLELGQVDTRISTLEAVEDAFQKAGIEFINERDGSFGVKLRAVKTA